MPQYIYLLVGDAFTSPDSCTAKGQDYGNELVRMMTEVVVTYFKSGLLRYESRVLPT
jgi:hypothetical protein